MEPVTFNEEYFNDISMNYSLDSWHCIVYQNTQNRLKNIFNSPNPNKDNSNTTQ